MAYQFHTLYIVIWGIRVMVNQRECLDCIAIVYFKFFVNIL